jgi:hypothetical protein
MSQAATKSTIFLRSMKSPQPTLSFVRRLNTGMANPDPRHRCLCLKWPSFKNSTDTAFAAALAPLSMYQPCGVAY